MTNNRMTATSSKIQHYQDVLSDVTDSVSSLANRVKDVSTEMAKESVSFVKKYPIHTALGTLFLGFVVGKLNHRK